MGNETVVLRTSVIARLLRVAPLGVWFTFLWLIGVGTGDGPGYFPLVCFGIGLLVGLPLVARMRVVLGPDRLTVVGWRRWDMAWSEVQGVVPPAFGWFRRRSVAVYDGRAWRSLLVLTVGWPWERRRVQAQYHQVGQWWLDHRGADWQPMPPPAPIGDPTNPYATP
jgi:hypothetical protein